VRRGLRIALVAVAIIAAWVGIKDVRRGYYTTRGASVVRFTIHSRYVHRDLHEILVVPSGGAHGRFLLVFLHGRGSSPSSNLRQHLCDGLHDLGRGAPAVLLADDDGDSYWHDRRDGQWGTEVLREAIPAALERSGADSRRVAIGGISMGGFGALDIARRAPRFCAVGAHSAALWFRAGDTAPGAFDNAEDFARHDLLHFARVQRLYDVPVYLDVGRDDSFAAADEALARELRAKGTRVELDVHGGGHSGWSGRMAAYLRFYSRACS